MKALAFLGLVIVGLGVAGCGGTLGPAGPAPGLPPAVPNEAASLTASPTPLDRIYAQLRFDGKIFSVLKHACDGFRVGESGSYQAPTGGALVLKEAISVAPVCRPKLPSSGPLFVVGVAVAGGSKRGVPIAGPARLQANPWKFAPVTPRLIVKKGARYDFFVATFASPTPSPCPSPSPSPTPSPSPSPTPGTPGQPWQMFHGNAAHTGYAAVSGPAAATLKWRFQAGTGVGAPPTSVAISSAGIIYLTGQANVYALNGAGSVVWQKPYATTPNPQGPALSNDGSTLYFAAGSSLVAVSAATGAPLWSYATGGDTLFGPTISTNGTILQGSHDTYLYAINPDGTLDWRYATQGAVSYPSSVDASGNVYLGGGDAHSGPDPNVYSFTPGGALRWKYNTGETRVGTPAIAAGGAIFAPADPVLIAFNASSGSVLWQAPDCGPPPLLPCGSNATTGIIAPAIGPDGTVYVANDKGVVSAIDPTTGATKWSYSTPSTTGVPSFPVVDANGTVYYGGENGTMYAIGKSGTLVWSYPTGGAIAEAAPALGPDGTLYFSSSDGYLYAIGTVSPTKKHRVVHSRHP